MIVYKIKTNLDPEEVIDRAKAYFGEELGLEVEDRGTCCAYFNDPESIGYVSVRIEINDEEKSEVTLETREYEALSKPFLDEIG